ncbi:MAG: Rieske (2Fe-2S) protein [Bacilli bacterium]|nr:Rieske (2Fe-2S) protein [Bacilli bacterium]
MGVSVSYTDKQKGLTRRQFLTYALGGTGAFMAVAAVGPLIPFAVDPLTRGTTETFSTVGTESEFNTSYPLAKDFTLKQKDGWIQVDNTYTAFIIKQQDGTYLAMSNICTHLGCAVSQQLGSDGKPTAFSNGIWFQCPCHGSQFSLTGVQTPVSPAQRPLDIFLTKVDSTGQVLVGSKKHQRTV